MIFYTRPIERWPGKLLKPHERQGSRFSAGWTETMDLLQREAEHLGADEVVIQMALTEDDIRLDGKPRANASPSHPGVIVSLESDHGPLSFPCDTFGEFGGWKCLRGWQANVRAIALGMEHLRAVDRYGITTHGEQYVGWKAIESGEGAATSLEVAAGVLLEFAYRDSALRDAKRVPAESLIEDAEARAWAYRMAAKATHPDAGGDPEDFRKVQLALEVLSR